MSKESKKPAEAKTPLQFRIPRDEKRGADLISKIEKIASVNSLSINDVANLAVAAGLSMVEEKLREIQQPEQKAA